MWVPQNLLGILTCMDLDLIKIDDQDETELCRLYVYDISVISIMNTIHVHVCTIMSLPCLDAFMLRIFKVQTDDMLISSTW